MLLYDKNNDEFIKYRDILKISQSTLARRENCQNSVKSESFYHHLYLKRLYGNSSHQLLYKQYYFMSHDLAFVFRETVAPQPAIFSYIFQKLEHEKSACLFTDILIY